MGREWETLLADEVAKPYFMELQAFIDHEYQTKTIYPPKDEIYRAFDTVDYSDVRVVILGQDPYPGANQAMGLSFSIHADQPLPRSLVNIFKELHDDLGITNTCGDLMPWAKQGVFLLNTVLSVEAGNANSHRNQGWEMFTDRVITLLSNREKPMVFVLWGNAARRKSVLIHSRHLVVESAHPSPLSARNGFFGSRVFSRINTWLVSQNDKPIDWRT